jgi:hypothetical protein
MASDLLKLFYANGRSTLVLEADVKHGWERRQKTYGFFQARWVPLRGDIRIRTQMAFIAQPATFSQRAALPPAITERLELEHVRLQYAPELLRSEVDILDYPWRLMSTNRPGIFIEVLPFLQIVPGLWYDLRIWIVFHGIDTLKPPPIEREYGDGTALAGGLPETNRRRH